MIYRIVSSLSLLYLVLGVLMCSNSCAEEKKMHYQLTIYEGDFDEFKKRFDSGNGFPMIRREGLSISGMLNGSEFSSDVGIINMFLGDSSDSILEPNGNVLRIECGRDATVFIIIQSGVYNEKTFEYTDVKIIKKWADVKLEKSTPVAMEFDL